jgi:8-oxo-dGTP diphosphatase
MMEDRIHVALAACFSNRGEILIARRPDQGEFGGFWELPGGKIESGELPQAAALRELAEETGIHATAVGELPPFLWDYPHIRLQFFPVVCRIDTDAPALPDDGVERKWVKPTELSSYRFPRANAELNRKLVQLAAER